MRRLTCHLLLFLVVPAVAFSDGPERTGERCVVFRGDLANQVLLTGEMVAEEAEPQEAPNVNIWPLQIRWLLEDGSPVQAGDKVVEFDNSQLISNLDEKRVRVVEAENRLASTAAQGAASVEDAELEVERRRAQLGKAEIDTRVPEGLLAALDIEKRRLELSRARLGLQKAENQLENQRRITETDMEIQRIALDDARAEVVKAQEGSKQLVLRATRTGIVIISRNWHESRNYQSGDTTHPGSIIARLPDLETMIVEARLYDVDDGRIAAGQRVSAVLDAFPDTTYTGTVREIASFATEASRMSLRRCSRTVIDLDDLDTERMLPGMSVKAVVHGPTLHDVLLVPRSALRWYDDGPRVVLANGREVPVTPPANSWDSDDDTDDDTNKTNSDKTNSDPGSSHGIVCNAHVCAVHGVEGIEEGGKLSCAETPA